MKDWVSLRVFPETDQTHDPQHCNYQKIREWWCFMFIINLLIRLNKSHIHPIRSDKCLISIYWMTKMMPYLLFWWGQKFNFASYFIDDLIKEINRVHIFYSIARFLLLFTKKIRPNLCLSISWIETISVLVRRIWLILSLIRQFLIKI